jgi:hypothetical protein
MLEPQTTLQQVASHIADKAKTQPLYSLLTQEEHQAVVEKLRQAASLPAGHLPLQEQLYLEQQLADLLGFEVTAELDGHKLNHSIGLMAALPHLRRHPTDTLAAHSNWQSAGMSAKRSSFGWFTQQGELTSQSVQREEYFLAVQAQYLPDWPEHSTQLKDWYKFRKMIVVNPFEQMVVVGVVGTLGPANWLQRQFGGSPELIQAGKIWSPRTRGRVLVFFVNDLEESIPLGPRSLDFPQP